MHLAYVDTGGMLKEVAALEAAGLLKTHYFHRAAKSPRQDLRPRLGRDLGVEQSELKRGSWNLERLQTSALFEPLRKLLGAQVDAKHLDWAAKAGCSLFLTSDKTDIRPKRDELQALANIRVLHMPYELAILRQLAE